MCHSLFYVPAYVASILNKKEYSVYYWLDVMALRACGFVIFRRLAQQPPPDNTEFLLLQTSYGEHHWTPPKGASHSPHDAFTVMLTLERTQEEAGLGKDHLRMVDGFLQRLHYQVRGKDKEVIYWLAELRYPNTQVILSDEHQDYRWAKLEEACKLAKYQDLQDTLTAAQHYLETQGKQ
ncbi:bis(5'-nucleosyl)-tetraphosphatase [asymmetrical]-like [Cyprinus carpio]|uniref:bis(5'-nucleosyl)-tetraphosphatase (asymmetrical) n=1 Tax=Cyprinus carpio TaxID=7962 RepID=A0A9R0BH57_CYPCA|nr:bis(5'-nucleosyl)-tetraphosphatase [asymmetrical]-like [Cyprinus carpio]